jgi:hypothetical protein
MPEMPACEWENLGTELVSDRSKRQTGLGGAMLHDLKTVYQARSICALFVGLPSLFVALGAIHWPA